MRLKIERYDQDCENALSSQDVTAEPFPLPLKEGDSFTIWSDNTDGIPSHGGIYCASSDSPGFESAHPFGVEVSFGPEAVSKGKVKYTVTVVAVECPCAGGKP